MSQRPAECETPPCEIWADFTPRSGLENMQLDESLLERVTLEGSTSFVRIYRWSEPTVSLGYFQHVADDVDPRIVDCPKVKRITGGGAILHDQELTYSCVLPACHPFRRNPIVFYEAVHSSIIEVLDSFGVATAMRKDAASHTKYSSEQTAEPFLCFLRSDPRDVVLRGHKVIGSAQRRRRGTILQHGSILLRASELTPEVLGIYDLTDTFPEQEFSEKLPYAIGRAVSNRCRTKNFYGIR